MKQENLEIFFFLSQWAANFKFSQIPVIVIEAAKRSMIDTFAVGCAGSTRSIIKSLKECSQELYSGTNANYLDCETTLSPVGAALINGAACHVLDFDDTFYPGVLHPSTVVFPAALAVAQGINSDGKSLLTAMIAGLECECIIGKIVEDTLYDQGWFPTVILGVVGSAIAASHLLQLSPLQTYHAINIAFSQGSLLQKRGISVRPYLVGRAASIGVESAYLARRGIALKTDSFQQAIQQIFARINPNTNFEISKLQELGKVWSLVEPSFAIKKYPACSSVQAAGEGLENLVKQYKITPDEIVSVECEVTAFINKSLDFDRPKTPTEAQFSLQFALASLLIYGELTPRQLTEATLKNS